jgi:hypothetical protein
MTTSTPLHGAYDPLTRIEREMVKAAFCQLGVGRKDVPQSKVVSELVRNGIPTAERAELVVEMSFFPGGPPSTVLGMVIAKHSLTLDTGALVSLIERHLPGTPIAAIIAECTRQGEAAKAEAKRLRSAR